MRMSDWSSDVCASDLPLVGGGFIAQSFRRAYEFEVSAPWGLHVHPGIALGRMPLDVVRLDFAEDPYVPALQVFDGSRKVVDIQREMRGARSEEHTSELQSLMRISYAVFSLKKKKKIKDDDRDRI